MFSDIKIGFNSSLLPLFSVSNLCGDVEGGAYIPQEQKALFSSQAGSSCLSCPALNSDPWPRPHDDPKLS